MPASGGPTRAGARILPIRVLDEHCSGTAFSFAAGIVAAVEGGARIINASLGALESSLVVQQAVSYAVRNGVLFVAPTGNVREGERGTEHLAFPARQYPEVTAVAAVTSGYVAAPWAVLDHRVAFAAPGIDLIVAHGGGWALGQGSSFSAALVSGAAAAALGADPGLTRRTLLKRLEHTAIGVDSYNRQCKGKLGRGVPDVGRLAGHD